MNLLKISAFRNLMMTTLKMSWRHLDCSYLLLSSSQEQQLTLVFLQRNKTKTPYCDTFNIFFPVSKCLFHFLSASNILYLHSGNFIYILFSPPFILFTKETNHLFTLLCPKKSPFFANFQSPLSFSQIFSAGPMTFDFQSTVSSI